MERYLEDWGPVLARVSPVTQVVSVARAVLVASPMASPIAAQMALTAAFVRLQQGMVFQAVV